MDRAELSSFARQLEEEARAASDLWSWLPSYKAAEECAKEHGIDPIDHQMHVQPSIADIITEATLYFIEKDGVGLEDHEKNWFDCPCELRRL